MRFTTKPRGPVMRVLCVAVAAAPLVGACTPASAGPGADAASPDATAAGPDSGPTNVIPLDALAPDADAIPEPGTFCSLPGSIVATSQGEVIMPGDVVVPGSDAGAP